MKNVEALLNEQLTACLAAMQDCLAHSRNGQDDDYGETRRSDVAIMAKLVTASARLGEALAKLKGETRMNIHVTRQDVDRGGGG